MDSKHTTQTLAVHMSAANTNIEPIDRGCWLVYDSTKGEYMFNVQGNREKGRKAWSDFISLLLLTRVPLRRAQNFRSFSSSLSTFY